MELQIEHHLFLVLFYAHRHKDNNSLDEYIKTKNIECILNCYSDLDDDVVKIRLEKDKMPQLNPLIEEKFNQMLKTYDRIKKYKEAYFEDLQ